MEHGFIEKVYKSVIAKISKLENKFTNYALRAMAAGMFLTLAYTFCMQLTSDFNATEIAPVGKILMSYLFGIGLIFIIYFGAELFTSNAMYFSVGVMHKKISVGRALKLLCVCWIFNFVGAAFCALLLSQTGLFDAFDGEFPNQALYTLAAKKATLPVSQTFFRAILANWVVNVVIFIQAVVKDDVSKLLIVPLGLVPFVYLGFEHSIANFGVFLMTWLTPGAAEAAVYHGANFTTSGAFLNLAVATVGNLIGGGILVGGYFAYLNRDKIDMEEGEVQG